MNEIAAVEAVTRAIGSATPTRADILAFEQMMTEQPGAVFELPTFHHFAPGLYAREVRIPAGMALTGKTHRFAQLNVLAAGRITVWIDGGMRTIEAPHTFVSEAGTKRVGFAHTDVTWITFHATTETDLEKIEADVIAPPDFDLVSGAEMEVLP